MGVPHTAECQIQQFPIATLSLVDLGYRKLSHHVIAAEHRMQRDAAPDNGSIVEHFCRDARFSGVLVLPFCSHGSISQYAACEGN